MFTGIIIGIVAVVFLTYVHRVGLPRVLAKIEEAGKAIEAAIHNHGKAVSTAASSISSASSKK